MGFPQLVGELAKALGCNKVVHWRNNLLNTGERECAAKVMNCSGSSHQGNVCRRILWQHHRHVLREGRLFARGRHGTGSDVERIVEFVTMAANCATEGRASENDDWNNNLLFHFALN